MSRHIIAAIQMTSTQDKSRNLDVAQQLIRKAASQGARLVALPELFNGLGSPETIVAGAEPVPGPTSELMSRLARELKIILIAGSMAEQGEPAGARVFNSSLIFDADGQQLSKYRKLHLFDIDLPGTITFRESEFMSPGDSVRVTPTPLGTLGQATCYDLRFPELFRMLVARGAEMAVVPSAFTMPTGRDHWEVLLRARAIENQIFIVAPNQCGKHGDNLHTYGRSMIIDPWGTVLATAADGEGVICAEIDLKQLAAIRSRLPCLQHRRELESL